MRVTDDVARRREYAKRNKHKSEHATPRACALRITFPCLRAWKQPCILRLVAGGLPIRVHLIFHAEVPALLLGDVHIAELFL